MNNVFNSVTEITEDVARLRKDGGKWLKDLRERRGLSQKDLAELVNVQFNTFISQLENGRGRIPPERYELWAAALGILPYQFVERVLFYYDPMTHKILFGNATSTGSIPALRLDSAPAYEADASRINELHRLIGKIAAEIEMMRSHSSVNIG